MNIDTSPDEIKAQEVSVTPAPEAPPAKPAGKTLEIPESAMSALKADERRKGAEAARQEAAAAAGFASYDEMIAAAKDVSAAKAKAAAEKAEAEKLAADKQAAEKTEAEKKADDGKKRPDTTGMDKARAEAKLAKERDDAIARAKQAEKLAAEAESKAKQAEARADLRVRVTRVAIEAGAYDADDIVPLVEAQVAALKPEDAGTFDVAAAVKELQTKKEHLFKPAMLPAGGNRGRATPPPPVQNKPGGKPKSAFEMTADEVAAATNRFLRM